MQVKMIGGKLYVVDASGNQVAGPFNTIADANAALAGGGAATATPTAGARPAAAPKSSGGPFSTIAAGVQGLVSDVREAWNEANAAPGVSVSDMAKAVKSGNATPQQMLNALYATGKYTIETAEMEMRANGVQPPPREGATGGAVSGSGSGSGTAKTAAPAPPDWLKGWVDAFQGLSDDDIVKAYYAGEEGLDRNVLGALLMYRNTKTDAKGASTNKWSEASLNRYLDQIDAEKPTGLTKADISEMYDPSRADFGARGTFASSALNGGQAVPSDKLFTPNSGGRGLVPAADAMGNLFAAGAVVNNQLFTPEHIAMIAQQRGMKPGSTLSDIGQSLETQQNMANMYPESTPSQQGQAMQMLAGAYNPAGRVDPKSGRPALEMNEYELMRLAGEGVFRARGGPVQAGQPYIVGEKRPEVFVPAQNGTILPAAPKDEILEKENRTPDPYIARDLIWEEKNDGGAVNQRGGLTGTWEWAMRQHALRNRDSQSDPNAGRIFTQNPRLYAENPRLYHMDRPQQTESWRYPGLNAPPPPPEPPMSLFEKALLASMQRRGGLMAPGVY